MQTNITEHLLKRKDKHYETCKNLFDFLIILSCFTAGFSMTALAGNDNVAFSFTMKANSARNYTGNRYRETTRTNNPWKVNMTGSTEEIIHKHITFWQATVRGGYNIQTNILLKPEAETIIIKLMPKRQSKECH